MECCALENKIDIMKNKGRLIGVSICIEDDLTEREKKVQVWLEKLAKEERRSGKEVKAGHI